MPIDQLWALEKTAINNSVWVGLGLLAFQLLLSVLLGLKVSAPIGKITRYAQAVAAGNSDAQLDVHSRDDMMLAAINMAIHNAGTYHKTRFFVCVCCIADSR